MIARKLDHLRRGWLPAALALLLLAAAAPVHAFCGFYVTGADAKLYANATMVVLMRDGTRTVLSMQNNYQGPPEQFALVIPVPTVLQKDQVKVLPKEVFQRVDTLGAPRLVEYWEQDPCYVPPAVQAGNSFPAAAPTAASAAAGASAPAAVRIEAQFAVGEYDVVVLSADDSSALDSWLHSNKYNIPDGAQPVLAPYVAAGMKFFVAKVDPARVTFSGGQAALSPLRFHYDTQEFSLPVRLGLLNSQGSQDLLVNILATDRYELANYPNVTVPTNIRVQNDVRDDFASFYEALFSKVMDKHPKAVVTEYSWASGSCDPCPGPTLTPEDLMTLGADVLQSQTPAATGTPNGVPVQQSFSPIIYNMTLTRLHARYGKDSLGEDLVFKVAQGLEGGRGIPDTQGLLDPTTQLTGLNNFQGRYVILHPWESPITCQSPQRGIWGGPNGRFSTPTAQGQKNNALIGAAPSAGNLPALLAESLPALEVKAQNPLEPLGTVKATPAPAPAANGGTGGSASKAAAGSKSTAPFNPITPAIKPNTPTANSTAATPTEKPTTPAKSTSGCSITAANSSNPVSAYLYLAAATLLCLRRRRTP